MFSQTRDILANVPDLNMMVGITFHIDKMIKISGKITGLDYLDSPVALVWASASPGRTYYLFDELARFYLHTPQSTSGSYSITFSCPGYDSYVGMYSTNDQVLDVVVLLEQSGAPFP